MIVAPTNTDTLRDSEAYGDWASYRDEFVQQAHDSFCIAQLNEREYRRYFVSPSLSEEFATLFVRKGKDGLLYRGIVLEPWVYRAGLDYLGGGAASEISHSGLSVIVVRKR